ncbi:MAG: hypothetical protein ACN2B6_12170 [Rickettsiales bacterium]
MTQFLMLMALFAIVLLTAVCAYCLSVAALRYSDEVFLVRAQRVIRKVIVVGGVLFLIWLAYCAVMALGVGFIQPAIDATSNP